MTGAIVGLVRKLASINARSALQLTSTAGGPTARTVCVALATAICLLFRRLQAAALFVVAVGGAGALNSFIKAIIARRRPPARARFLLARKRSSGHSFPSGHASGTVALLGTTTYIVWQWLRIPWVTALTAIASGAVTAGVGVSRVALGQHHVGDVVGGYILGGLGLWCATRIVKIAPAEGGKPDGE